MQLGQQETHVPADPGGDQPVLRGSLLLVPRLDRHNKLQ
jgi:hypothetical protein